MGPCINTQNAVIKPVAMPQAKQHNILNSQASDDLYRYYLAICGYKQFTEDRFNISRASEDFSEQDGHKIILKAMTMFLHLESKRNFHRKNEKPEMEKD